jgi:FkbM family methyltransferase
MSNLALVGVYFNKTVTSRCAVPNGMSVLERYIGVRLCYRHARDLGVARQKANMSLMSSKSVLQLRGAARALGVPRLLGRFAKDYESSFSRQMMSACRSGDVVWDVGANVGQYSLNFSKWVGHSGEVFAFEPGQGNQSELRSACGGTQNVKICEFGLSDKSERRRFLQGSDSSTWRVLLPNEAAPEGAVEVDLRTEDDVIQSGQAGSPNVIKIDVEGHELSVLKGLQLALPIQTLRSVFVEVHFGILDSSDRSDDPKQIEDILKRSGFKLSWTDRRISSRLDRFDRPSRVQHHHKRWIGLRQACDDALVAGNAL